jgi:hypothetical protein
MQVALVPAAIRQTKALRQRIGDFRAAFEQVESSIAEKIVDVEAIKARGEEVWPVSATATTPSRRVSRQLRQVIRRRGCLIVRGHFWQKRCMEPQPRRVRQTARLRRPVPRTGNDIFGTTLASSRLEIYRSPDLANFRPPTRAHVGRAGVLQRH